MSIGDVTATSDKTGMAHFVGLHPGPTKLSITKSAYTPWAAPITIGFGDNGTSDARITSTGIRLTFKLTNYVTGKPVAGARVQVGDADVVSGSDGQVVASVTPADNPNQPVTASITKDGFNNLSTTVTIKQDAGAVSAKLVPAGQVYFLSNRSGRVDLYAANLDGSAATVILPGTGNEDASTGILPNVYDQLIIALVSSRAGHRQNGSLQEDLYVFRPATKQLTLVDANISFGNYRAWLGKRLVYVKYFSENGTNRTTIQSYDPDSGKNATLVACTGDGACPTPLFTNGDLFVYSLSGAPAGSSSNGIFVVKSGSTTSKSVSSTPASTTVRQTESALLLQYYNYNPYSLLSTNLWQSLDLDKVKVSSLANGPADTVSRVFVDSPGDKFTVSVDKRDGQSDLYLTGAGGGHEQQLTNTGNVSQFVQWFGDDYIVYSAANQLFVVGTAGGQPQKIANFYSGDVQTYAGGFAPNY